MWINEFYKKYGISTYLFQKHVKRGQLKHGIHFEYFYTIHNRKIKILKPEEIYSIITGRKYENQCESIPG